MQLVRIVSGIRLIGFVTACLLLCSAQSFEPAPKLYRAKREDVPPWAEQGNFRFIRIDGRRIENWKAERTWWGSKFSAEEKDVLTHIYDRDFEQMLGLLKQADFNWIWVTWSSGWSLKDEEENRASLKKVIARCHENGIHVSAYLSASSMFRKRRSRRSGNQELRPVDAWRSHVLRRPDQDGSESLLGSPAGRHAQTRLAGLSLEQGGTGGGCGSRRDHVGQHDRLRRWSRPVTR